jgi:hypothetical protein
MGDDTVDPAIVDFFNSVSPNGTMTCHICGTAVEDQTSTFFYEDHTLEVTVPICPKCHRRPHVLTYDA